MAITGTNRGSGGNTTNASTLSITPGSNFSSYSTAVLCMAYDNDGTDGIDTILSVHDSHGNFWVPIWKLTYTPGSVANDGVCANMWYCYQENETLSTGSTITVTYSGSLVAKRWTLTEFSTDLANGIVLMKPRLYKAASGTGTSTTITSSSLVSGDCIIAMTGAEVSDAAITEDTDSSNGTWNTAQISSGTGMSIYSQFKVITGTGTQTFDLSGITSGDYITGYAVFYEVPSSVIAISDATYDSSTSSTSHAVTTGGKPSALTSVDSPISGSGAESVGTLIIPQGSRNIGQVWVAILWFDSAVYLVSVSGIGANSYTTYTNSSYSGQVIVVVPITETIADGTTITFTFSGNTIKGFNSYKVCSIRGKSLAATDGPYEYVSQSSDSTFVTNTIPENSVVIVTWQGNTYPTAADTDTTDGYWGIIQGTNSRYSGSQDKTVTASGAQTHSFTTNTTSTAMARCALVVTESDATAFDPFGQFGFFGI